MGLLVAASLMVATKWKMKPLTITGFVLVAFAFTLLLLGRLDRIASQGLFDGGRWSVYNLVLEAIQERPLLGWGNGTFADLFPALRDAVFIAGVSGISRTQRSWRSPSKWGLPVAVMILIGPWLRSSSCAGRGNL